MASKRERQRRLERARVERRIARQAHRTRRRRQIQAGVAASLALVLIVLGVTWLLGGFDTTPDEGDNVARGSCSWTLLDQADNPGRTDMGHPPTTGELRSGVETMTIKTNLGEIQAVLDLSRAPCTAASFAYLGEKKLYEGTKCHRLNTETFLLACGDPNGDGSGGPGYQFADENVPTAPPSSASPAPSVPSAPAGATASPGASASPATAPIYYAKGTIIMINSGPNTNGSQFYIIYDQGSTLGPAYSIVGTVTRGLDLVEQVGRAGAVNETGAAATEGTPKTDLIIQQLYLGAPPSATPSAATSSSAAASPAASATAQP